MKNREMYAGIVTAWPQWLTDEERERLMLAARSGDNAERDSIIIAGLVYLGLTIDEAVKVRYCTACGDAIEDRKRGAFLHIPNEYRKIISNTAQNKGTIQLKERLTQCTQKEAKTLVLKAFERAGMVTDYCFMRLRRTAAHLHYINQWTNSGDIERWFYEIGYIKDEDKELYYRERYEDSICFLPDME